MNKTDIIDKLLKLAILLMRSSSEPYTKPFLELLEEKFREVDLPATTLPVLRYAPLLLKQSTLETLPFVKEFVSEIGNLNWHRLMTAAISLDWIFSITMDSPRWSVQPVRLPARKCALGCFSSDLTRFIRSMRMLPRRFT